MTNSIAVGKTFPEVSVQFLDDPAPGLGRPQPDHWQLLVVYRGLHCPICKKYLTQLDQMKDEFDKMNVDVIAVSTDPEEKAGKFRDDNRLGMPIGYGLSIDDARSLGLFISEPMSSAETDQPFAEPGTYVIRPDGVVQIMDVSNAPFSRPDLQMLKGGIEYVRGAGYPVRGDA